MSQKIKIGELTNKAEVRISSKSPNEHLLLVGTSGSGKSTRIKEILVDSIQQGETVMAFDLNGSDFSDFSEDVNYISARDDGLNFTFLDTKYVEKGLEINSNFISGIVESFSAVANLGVRQGGALRSAILFAVEQKNEYEEEMLAIAEGLKIQNNEVSKGVYSKLWNIFEGGVFRKSKKCMKKGKINVLSFEGINPTTQKQCIELILRLIWKECRLGLSSMEKKRIVIDEFQNLSLRQNSVLMEMLREARKYEVSLLLATQSVSNFTKEIMSAVNQTAVQLYFRQSASDIRQIADIIEFSDRGRWIHVLKNLAIGESVATGDFTVEGREIAQPIIVKSAYRNDKKTIYMLR